MINQRIGIIKTQNRTENVTPVGLKRQKQFKIKLLSPHQIWWCKSGRRLTHLLGLTLILRGHWRRRMLLWFSHSICSNLDPQKLVNQTWRLSFRGKQLTQTIKLKLYGLVIAPCLRLRTKRSQRSVRYRFQLIYLRHRPRQRGKSKIISKLTHEC